MHAPVAAQDLDLVFKAGYLEKRRKGECCVTHTHTHTHKQLHTHTHTHMTITHMLTQPHSLDTPNTHKHTHTGTVLTHHHYTDTCTYAQKMCVCAFTHLVLSSYKFN